MAQKVMIPKISNSKSKSHGHKKFKLISFAPGVYTAAYDIFELNPLVLNKFH